MKEYELKIEHKTKVIENTYNHNPNRWQKMYQLGYRNKLLPEVDVYVEFKNKAIIDKYFEENKLLTKRYLEFSKKYTNEELAMLLFSKLVFELDYQNLSYSKTNFDKIENEFITDEIVKEHYKLKNVLKYYDTFNIDYKLDKDIVIYWLEDNDVQNIFFIENTFSNNPFKVYTLNKKEIFMPELYVEVKTDKATEYYYNSLYSSDNNNPINNLVYDKAKNIFFDKRDFSQVIIKGCI